MNSEDTCQANDRNGPCVSRCTLTTPVRLCALHALQVARQTLPQILDAAAIHLDPAGPFSDRLDVSSLLSAGGHEPIVYFIQHGERIKIGTTRNLRGRIAALSLRADDALLALKGDESFEGALHTHFSSLRIGDTEWFNEAPELRQYISTMNARPAIGTMLAASVRRPDRRRALVFELVQKAGPDGIRPVDIVRQIADAHPHVDVPDRAVITRWLSADPRVTKPSYGRYAAHSESDSNSDRSAPSPPLNSANPHPARLQSELQCQSQ